MSNVLKTSAVQLPLHPDKEAPVASRMNTKVFVVGNSKFNNERSAFFYDHQVRLFLFLLLPAVKLILD